MHEIMIKLLDTEVNTIIGNVYKIVTTSELKELFKVYSKEQITILKGVCYGK